MFPDTFLQDRRERRCGGDRGAAGRGDTPQAPRRARTPHHGTWRGWAWGSRSLTSPGTRSQPRGSPREPGDRAARGSPASYVQPEEVGEPLEDAGAQAADAVVGEVPARQAEGLSGPGGSRCPRGSPRSCTSTYRRFSSGRPRKAPGWTVLIRLFFRSLRGEETDTELRVCRREPGTRPLPRPPQTRHSRDRGTSAPRSPQPRAPRQPQAPRSPLQEPH